MNCVENSCRKRSRAIRRVLCSLQQFLASSSPRFNDDVNQTTRRFHRRCNNHKKVKRRKKNLKRRKSHPKGKRPCACSTCPMKDSCTGGDMGCTFAVRHAKKTIQTITELVRKWRDLVGSVGRKTAEGAAGKNTAKTNKKQQFGSVSRIVLFFRRCTNSTSGPSQLDTRMKAMCKMAHVEH